MPAVSLHGVTIEWTLSGPPRDPLALLLSVFDPPPPVPPGGPLPSVVRFELLPAPASASADPRGEGWEPSFFHGAVETFRGPEGFLIWDHASRVLVRPGGAPIVAEIAPAEREVTPDSASTALQIALILALRPTGLFHLHAAALVLPTGVPVLVIGGTGAGKTTTTLALLEGSRAGGSRARAEYLGDDSLYLSVPDGKVRLVAFAREFHLGPATLSAFPRLAPLVGPRPPHTDKRPLDPRRAYPGRSRPFVSLPPAGALALFPSIVASPVTTVVPLPRAEAFGRLLASSGALVVEGVPGRDENIAALSALLKSVRCEEVRLGSDAMQDPSAAIAAKVA